jgi:hypothetical protein
MGDLENVNMETRIFGPTLILNAEAENLSKENTEIINITGLSKVEQLIQLAIANNISLYIRQYKKYDLDELLVWLDTVQDKLYMPLPEGLIFTGLTLTNIHSFKQLFRFCKCSESFLREFIKNIDNIDSGVWGIISGYQRLSERFIIDFKDKLDWKCISSFQVLSDKFIEEFKDKIDWAYLSINNSLSENIIRKYPDKIDWNYNDLYSNKPVSFFQEFKDYINWSSVIVYKNHDEEFLCEFIEYIDFNIASGCAKLSESFIRNFQNKVHWANISHYQKLSEDFIREFKDKVDWCLISNSQKISDDFIEEFIDKVDWWQLLCTPRSTEFYKRFNEHLDLENLYNRELSFDFVV